MTYPKQPDDGSTLIWVSIIALAITGVIAYHLLTK